MDGEPSFTVIFFRTSIGREPVRDWLKTLEKDDRKIIGEDIKLVQFRWPLGMPLVRKLDRDLWEVCWWTDRKDRVYGSKIRNCTSAWLHQKITENTDQGFRDWPLSKGFVAK